MEYIVILSHQGGSFINKLTESIRRMGKEPLLVSSRVNLEKIQNSSSTIENVKVMGEDNLSFDEVESYIADFGPARIGGFISVWEGYRPLMAKLNQAFGFNDIEPALAYNLRDKYWVREKLRKAGLTSVEADIFSEEKVKTKVNSKARTFIKPRFGLGSVAAKELVGEADIQYVEEARDKLRKDRLLSDALGDYEFILEDYIDGVELSAELLVRNGTVQILAFHEKIEVSYGLYTTTEPFCISPPTCTVDLQAAAAWLESVIAILGVTQGCYHVEFKVASSSDFEVIEVNPRIGGALIIESANYMSEVDSLACWISTLKKTTSRLGCQLNINKREASSEVSKAYRGTAFRVYFSERSGTVIKISKKHVHPAPAKYDILVDVGDKLEREQSEQYIAQSLWTGEFSSDDSRRKFFNTTRAVSRNFLSFEVRDKRYKPSFIIIDYNLNRKGEVIDIANIVKNLAGLESILLTEPGKEIENSNIDSIVAPEIRTDSFARNCIRQLQEKCVDVVAGIVFSDDAIVSGSKILSFYGVPCDSVDGALRSFNKLIYRKAEKAAHLPVSVNRPRFYQSIRDIEGNLLADGQPLVIKPCCEGNNRGVMVIESQADLKRAVSLNARYLNEGIFAEEAIPGNKEFSADGVGSLIFFTKKLSLHGQYPIEIGQVQPAFPEDETKNKLLSANSLANKLTGQRLGAFHNEIKISDKDGCAYVIEPNRRPGGMKIWQLIQQSCGYDLYAAWIFSALTGCLNQPMTMMPKNKCGLLIVPGPEGQVISNDPGFEYVNKIVSQVIDLTCISKIGTLLFKGYSTINEPGFVFPEEKTSAHDYWLSLRFESALDVDIELALYTFYETWEQEIEVVLSSGGEPCTEYPQKCLAISTS